MFKIEGKNSEIVSLNKISIRRGDISYGRNRTTSTFNQYMPIKKLKLQKRKFINK